MEDKNRYSIFNKIPFVKKRIFKDSEFFANRSKEQIDLDKRLVYSLSKSRIPTLRQLKYIGRYLSRKELWLIRISVLIIIASILISAGHFIASRQEEVPLRSGEYIEGVVGAPKNISPLYSLVNDPDQDLVNLIYSSLFKRDGNGNLKPDLVEDYNISEDGRVYDIKLKNNVKWHDGTLLNANDVIFTFNLILDKQFQSPLRASFSGVSIEKISEDEIKFVLDVPYAAFLDLLTFGIMPSGLWGNIGPEAILLSDLNIKPIGSGPYRYDEIIREKKSGLVKEYRLAINEEYYDDLPYIKIVFKYYPDYNAAIEALNNNQVDGLNYLPAGYKGNIITPKSINQHRLYTPQITLAFINQNNNINLRDKSVRQAMAYSLDRNTMVNSVLDGDAYLIDGPILPNNFAYNNNIKKYEYNVEQARTLLDNIDWKIASVSQTVVDDAKIKLEDDPDNVEAKEVLEVGVGEWRKKDSKFLMIKLTTADREENIAVAEAIKKQWDAIGIRTDIIVVPINQIQSQVIAKRDFEVLFFGQVLNPDPDPYAFWHSSQANEGGYNISNYFNKEADALLEDARLTTDQGARQEKYFRFQEIISEEVPAIFMYSTIYIYPQHNKVKGFDVTNIYTPSDRFNNVENWYLKMGKRLVW